MMGILGLLLATVGLDPTQGMPRFTFGVPELFDGLSFVPIVMGLFGLADIMEAVEGKASTGRLHPVNKLMPTGEEARRSAWPIFRGSGIGFLLGLIPGMMPSISRSEEHTSELQSLMRTSFAVFCSN